ncbi:HDOD domain-containing protein [Methylomonas montana]|uniref:HDOD domain-containing protein n=1 Tax=Methylomonas montana TaxID=3058963 RepID=UPI002657B836|nr:HDOD domain-containing protein [Methylomonas montana]WKJ90023.1 HDOD domain-containing protein [Methylomonas montana]
MATDSRKSPKSLDEWTELLRIQEMPIFSNTAQNIYAALDDRKKGAMELATVILQDPNLTAKLLKVGNSPYYNPSKQKMSTVSRAIVVLGAEVIRELTLACSFFEAILSSANKERANREIAQALHAAVQARELAITVRDTSPEEVFVAALLHNIGHIAFWCSNNPQSRKVHDLIEKSRLNSREAEKAVLGFTLWDLGKKLSKSWRLGGLIEEAIVTPNSDDKRVQMVQMGHRICDALKAGRDSEAMQECLEKIAAFSGLSQEAVKAKIAKNTSEAVQIARQFGANDASRYITSEGVPAGVDETEDTKIDKKELQFQILQDISSHISGNIDLNVLFEMVLEGIHRGVEMDRTLFMLLTPDKQTLNEKFSLGWPIMGCDEKIHIHHSESQANLLFDALQYQDGVWQFPEEHPHLYSAQIQQKIGKHECFVFPIHAENKAVGLIYCDRSLHGLPLTRDDFIGAKHFAKQAHIGLTLYCMKNH